VYWLLIAAVWAQAGTSLQTLVRQGQAALEKEDYASAVGAFAEAYQAAPQNLQVNRGLLLSQLQAGEISAAIVTGSHAVQRWPHDAELQHWLGLAYFKAGRNAEAIKSLQMAERTDPGRPDVHFDLALVLLTSDDQSAAAQEL
jgi:cytochrome c-type biogenesis protein CcmH/NrfG